MTLQQHTKIAMLQPNYIPWKGVFDLISRVDIFVFYDDVQYTSKDWRNRNKIVTAQGDLWLSVPVKHQQKDLICEVMIDQANHWQKKHHRTISLNYQKAPFFSDYQYLLDEIYLNRTWEKLSDLDIFSTKLISEALGLAPRWYLASELKISGNKNGEKIIKLCQALGANYFINGPSSKAFMDESLFKEAGIQLDYIEYDYPQYPQLHLPFRHDVTILDVIFNCGSDARKMITQLTKQ